MTGLAFVHALLRRDLRLASRRRTQTLLPLAFFGTAALLFPLGIGPEPQRLREIAPGIAWACALLAAMLPLQQLYAGDQADGSLEQLMLHDPSAFGIALSKAAVHWATSGLPLVIVAPLAGALMGLTADAAAMLALTLLLGTPVLSLLGSLGAALTLGLRHAAGLILLIVLPLCVPALVFGTGAVAAVDGGGSAAAHCELLGALLIASLALAPWAAAAALRISTE